MRRAAIAPFFTKRKVQIYYPFIIKLVEQFCKRLELEYKGTDQILSVNDLAGRYEYLTVCIASISRVFDSDIC